MSGNDFLDSIAKKNRPEPNIDGDFDCMVCRERIFKAYLDRQSDKIYWWCSQDHESSIGDIGI